MGTRSAQVVVTFTDRNPVLGNYNNAYADNLSFTVGAALPAPPPPTPPVSTVGQLDHVFMVYMENKGFTDIVGSPNAPYLNSLINTYGFASNYYALTHPSDPNYYPILGGSDFGINYNCPSNCFDQPNLADNIEAAGKTWAGYEEGGGGYTTPHRPATVPRLQRHLQRPRPRRGTPVRPDADGHGSRLACHHPELRVVRRGRRHQHGRPHRCRFGIVRWALSQLTGSSVQRRGGRRSGSRTRCPPSWTRPSGRTPRRKAPSSSRSTRTTTTCHWASATKATTSSWSSSRHRGPWPSGMREGAFVADDYYNHYSLLRTIEDSLGLPPLTNNDKYAQPMNEFWCLQSQCPPQPQDQPVRSPSGDRTSTNALIDDFFNPQVLGSSPSGGTNQTPR